MILVENLDTGYALQKLIPDSIFVHGDIDVDKRKIIYADIDKTKNKICIATYGVAAVGISITFLYNIILYNVGKAFVRCLQAIGRGLRRGTSNTNGQEKTKIRITDVTTDLKFSKRHLSIRKGYYKEEGLPFTITKVEI
jgi:superfamily II DNA or RNA helicase